MQVRVQLFASLKEHAGDVIVLEVPEPVTVTRLLQCFGEAHPRFKSALPHLNVAVDLTYARAEDPIGPGQEVAIFPPVSGG
jgi:molybdopterin converting factor small subunit